MIEILMKLFPFMNIVWFQGNWCTERAVDNMPVAIDSVVVHSFEMESICPPDISCLSYNHKDKIHIKQGSCGNVLHSWSEQKIGAHYIISCESVQKITSDLQKFFPDLEHRAAIGYYATYVHSPEDIALICCVSPEYAAYHAGLSRFRNFGNFQHNKNRYTLNFSSIGIEMQGNGFYEGDKTERNFDQFWPEQISMLTQLVKTLAKEHQLDTRTDVLTHSTIAPLRKKDPGRYFPFEKLAKEGIGWVLTEPVHKEENLPCVDDARNLLMRIGYQLPENVKIQDLQSEERYGCLFPSSSEAVLWSTLDGFALQYAPWAWNTQPSHALSLSQAERGRVVKALGEHVKFMSKEEFSKKS
jgi:N-acetyl-anhydromuramyl-L-alanine amidase AmpD